MSTMARPFADLTGMRAVVTGGSSGIGRAIALELARGGSQVVVHYGSSPAAAERVVEEIRAVGGEADSVQADLRSTDPERIVDLAWMTWNGIDIWVNNAGADLLTGSTAKLSYEEKLARLWEVDVQGTIRLSRSIAERMKPHGQGVILNIGWDQADRGMAGESAELFSAAKNAIMGFTRSLALSVSPEVRVNCIAPGWIRTAWGEQASPAWQHRVQLETPLRRWGTPEDVAKFVRFLVSDDAAFITGQVMNVNGGAVR